MRMCTQVKHLSNLDRNFLMSGWNVMVPGAGHWFNKLINEGKGFLTLDLPLPSPCLKLCTLHQGCGFRQALVLRGPELEKV